MNLLGYGDLDGLKYVPFYALVFILIGVLMVLFISVFICLAYILTSMSINKLYMKKKNTANILTFLPIVRWLVLIKYIDKATIIGLIMILIEMFKYFIIINIGYYLEEDVLYATIGIWALFNVTIYLFLRIYYKKSLKKDT